MCPAKYYKDMWPQRAHLLAPPTHVCSTRQYFICTDTQENAFQNIKCLLSEDVVLRFLDDSQPFAIYIDTSKYQSGATIKQNKSPIVYFSQIFNHSQRRYSTIEHKMLAIVKV